MPSGRKEIRCSRGNPFAWKIMTEKEKRGRGREAERSRPYATTFIDRGSAIRAIKCMQSRVNFIELSGGAKFCPAAVKCGGLNGHQGNA